MGAALKLAPAPANDNAPAPARRPFAHGCKLSVFDCPTCADHYAESWDATLARMAATPARRAR